MVIKLWSGLVYDVDITTHLLTSEGHDFNDNLIQGCDILTENFALILYLKWIIGYIVKQWTMYLLM